MSQASDRSTCRPARLGRSTVATAGRPEAYFFLFGPTIKETERIGDVAVVYLNGPLDHHAGEGCGDSYEALLDRFDTAVDGGEAGHRRPSLSSRLARRQGLRPERDVRSYKIYGARAGIKLYSYPNEMAAARICLSCACDEIIVPDSAIVGSIGVISTLVTSRGWTVRTGYGSSSSRQASAKRMDIRMPRSMRGQ